MIPSRRSAFCTDSASSRSILLVCVCVCVCVCVRERERERETEIMQHTFMLRVYRSAMAVPLQWPSPVTRWRHRWPGCVNNHFGGVTELSACVHHCVKSGDSYFRPARETQPDNTKPIGSVEPIVEATKLSTNKYTLSFCILLCGLSTGEECGRGPRRSS